MFSSQVKAADGSREFLMSCIYGTMAGTIIGAASLAVADKPSDKLQNIARGASLGLYFGILLGLYVVYMVPDESDELNQVLDRDVQFKSTIYPMLNQDMKLDGAGVAMNVFNF